MNEVNNIKHFNTGVDDLDKCLGADGISSDELVEICGASGSGKTYFCLKLTSLALLEQNIAVIYVDTSNYINAENISQVIKNYMTNTVDPIKKNQMSKEVLGRLRVIKIYDMEELVVFLSMIITQLKNNKIGFDFRLLVIDSLSALFSAVPGKAA